MISWKYPFQFLFRAGFAIERKWLNALGILSILLLPVLATGQVPILSLSSQTPELSITSGEYLPDPEGTLSISEFLDSNGTHEFTAFDSGNPGYTDEVKNYWLRFRIQNVDSFDREWIFNFDNWSYVTCYLVDARGKVTKKQTGHLLQYSLRDYPVANQCNILIPIQAQEVKTCYVLLQTRPDHTIRPAGFQYRAELRSLLDYKEGRKRQILSIFIGIFIVMFLYNLFIYFSTRDISYLFYLAGILGAIYITLHNAGYSVSIFSTWYDSFPSLRGIAESVVSGINMIFSILFTIYFLNTKQNLPFWHKILKWSIPTIVVLAIGVNINATIFLPLIGLVAILIIIVFLIVGYKGIRKRIPSAEYYLLAYVFTIISTLIIALAILGVLPINAFTFHYAGPTGYALQMLFFSFALANKINILKRDNEESRLRIIDHLKENELLQTKVTRELEEKVNERTTEINHQKGIIEAEKEKSENLLYNILPRPVAKELIETGITRPSRYDEVSVMFSDFVNFTNISASIPPGKLVQELNDLFFLFDDITTEVGLEKIKTIGDSYMAVSGLPEQFEDHAEKCVFAAMKMLQCIEERNKKSGIKWDIRIGIHSGPVVAGVVGKRKFTFDLWGDTVNTASRLESASEKGRINISAYTYDLVKHRFNCTYRGKIGAKGKGEMDMYFVDEEVAKP